jgi:hypothetical protein
LKDIGYDLVENLESGFQNLRTGLTKVETIPPTIGIKVCGVK